MRRLTDREIIKKRSMHDDLWATKQVMEADLGKLQLQVKAKAHQLKETDQDIRTLMTEILSGETDNDQMELTE
jgi:hypothetical protein